MPTRNVVLTEHHDAVIEGLVSSGRYQNASEVLSEGLRLIEQRERREATKLEALRAAAKVGYADIESGDFLDFDTFDDLADHIRALTEEAITASGTT